MSKQTRLREIDLTTARSIDAGTELRIQINAAEFYISRVDDYATIRIDSDTAEAVPADTGVWRATDGDPFNEIIVENEASAKSGAVMTVEVPTNYCRESWGGSRVQVTRQDEGVGPITFTPLRLSSPLGPGDSIADGDHPEVEVDTEGAAEMSVRALVDGTASITDTGSVNGSGTELNNVVVNDEGTYAWALSDNATNGIHSFDVSDFPNPEYDGSTALHTIVNRVFGLALLDADKLCILGVDGTDNWYLEIWDVSDGANPSRDSTLSLGVQGFEGSGTPNNKPFRPVADRTRDKVIAALPDGTTWQWVVVDASNTASPSVEHTEGLNNLTWIENWHYDEPGQELVAFIQGGFGATSWWTVVYDLSDVTNWVLKGRDGSNIVDQQNRVGAIDIAPSRDLLFYNYVDTAYVLDYSDPNDLEVLDSHGWGAGGGATHLKYNENTERILAGDRGNHISIVDTDGGILRVILRDDTPPATYHAAVWVSPTLCIAVTDGGALDALEVVTGAGELRVYRLLQDGSRASGPTTAELTDGDEKAVSLSLSGEQAVEVEIDNDSGSAATVQFVDVFRRA